MQRTKTVLVLGATGGIGGAVARGLLRRGFVVRALHRDPARVRRPNDGLTWISGDAMRAADVLAAADDAEAIVHAVNPPGYRNWDTLVLPMLDNTIAAARARHARIVLPGNVYNFGPDALPEPHEASAQNPITRKGAIRAAMERRLREAADEGATALIIRAGDYFGPGARSNSWFASAMVRPGRPVRRVLRLGDRGVGHQWAYLPDVAETMIGLLEAEARLAPFEAVHMAGHWDPDGTAMAAAIGRAVGRPDLPLRAFPWFVLTAAAPFVATFREMQEMRYLWRLPVRLGNDRLREILGREPHTPLDEAVRVALVDLGCLSAEPTDVGGSDARASMARSGPAG